MMGHKICSYGEIWLIDYPCYSLSGALCMPRTRICRREYNFKLDVGNQNLHKKFLLLILLPKLHLWHDL